MTNAVETRNVSKAFTSGVETIQAVDDVSLAVRAGEFVCLLGASGSGKTTLLNLLAGLDVADCGTISVAGVVVSGTSDAGLAALRLHTVGVVFQDNNLIDEFTARENVALPLEVLGMERAAANRQAQAALDRVDLRELGDRFPRQLSGGQRQRVGIARALVGDRSVLLADEPTGALDSKNSRKLFELLQRLSAEGSTVLTVTHDPLCFDYADRLLEMTDGQLNPRTR